MVTVVVAPIEIIVKNSEVLTLALNAPASLTPCTDEMCAEAQGIALALQLMWGVWPVIMNIALYLVTGLIDAQMLAYTLNMEEFITDISTYYEMMSMSFLYPLLFLGWFLLSWYMNGQL